MSVKFSAPTAWFRNHFQISDKRRRRHHLQATSLHPQSSCERLTGSHESKRHLLSVSSSSKRPTIACPHSKRGFWGDSDGKPMHFTSFLGSSTTGYRLKNWNSYKLQRSPYKTKRTFSEEEVTNTRSGVGKVSCHSAQHSRLADGESDSVSPPDKLKRQGNSKTGSRKGKCKMRLTISQFSTSSLCPVGDKYTATPSDSCTPVASSESPSSHSSDRLMFEGVGANNGVTESPPLTCCSPPVCSMQQPGVVCHSSLLNTNISVSSTLPSHVSSLNCTISKNVNPSGCSSQDKTSTSAAADSNTHTSSTPNSNLLQSTKSEKNPDSKTERIKSNHKSNVEYQNVENLSLVESSLSDKRQKDSSSRPTRSKTWHLWRIFCCLCCNENRSTETVENSRIPSTDYQSKIDPVSEEDEVSSDEVEQWSKSFDSLMQNSVGRKVFHKFLQLEFSEENILFWLSCQELKQEQCKDVIEEKARSIYEQYISILSPSEVSLDSRVRDIVNANMIHPSKSTFDEAQIQVYTLMQRDSYPRFLNSAVYKEFLKNTYSKINGSESTASSTKQKTLRR